MSDPFAAFPKQGGVYNQHPAQPYRGWHKAGYAFDKKQAAKDRSNAQRVQVWDQAGTIQVVTPTTGTEPVIGEGVVSVTFTYSFVQKPIFTFGQELGLNQSATTGSFPLLTACVHRWDTIMAGYTVIYLGATIGFVVSGSINQKSFLHYSFRGQAMLPVTDAFNDLGTL